MGFRVPAALGAGQNRLETTIIATRFLIFDSESGGPIFFRLIGFFRSILFCRAQEINFGTLFIALFSRFLAYITRFKFMI